MTPARDLRYSDLRVAQDDFEPAGDPPTEEYTIIHRVADRVEASLRQAIVDAIGAMSAGLSAFRIRQAVRSKDAGAVADAVGLREGVARFPLEARIRELVDRTFSGAGTAIGEELAGDVGIEFEFDATNPRAVRWAREHAADLVQSIGLRSREGIIEAVQTSLRGGMDPVRLADAIEDGRFVGLSRTGARAVARLERDLSTIAAALDEGEVDADVRRLMRRSTDRRLPDGVVDDMSDAFDRGTVRRDQIVRWVDEYDRSMKRHRALKISRTETIRAANRGQREVWKQAADRGHLARPILRRWVVTPDDRLCPVCAPMAGQVRGIDEPFVSPTNGATAMTPPIHTMGRCGETLALDRMGERGGSRPS